MENQTDQLPRSKRIRWKPYCRCISVILAIPILLSCLLVAWLKGVPDDVSRWIRSFDYPAIEARYKPIADQLAQVTSDALIDESQQIGQPHLATNYDHTGVVAGDYTKVFGTNRGLAEVLNDYEGFLSSKPEWQMIKGGYWLAIKADHTAEVSVRVLDKSESPPGAWARYPLVYQVALVYGDPTLWGA